MVLKELSEDKFDTKLSDLMRPILSFNEDDSVYQIWEKMLEKREHIVDEDDVAVDMQAFAKEKSRRMLKK